MALKTKNAPQAQPTSETDTRLGMLNTLLTTPHRDLTKVFAVHQDMIKQDPLFYVRLAAWYNDTGEIRDHKEVFVISLCLSDFPGHRDVGLAMLRELPPYQVGRVVDFIHGKKVKEVTKTETGIFDYLFSSGGSLKRDLDYGFQGAPFAIEQVDRIGDRNQQQHQHHEGRQSQLHRYWKIPKGKTCFAISRWNHYNCSYFEL